MGVGSSHMEGSAVPLPRGHDVTVTRSDNPSCYESSWTEIVLLCVVCDSGSVMLWGGSCVL